MASQRLSVIIPPLPTPLLADGRSTPSHCSVSSTSILMPASTPSGSWGPRAALTCCRTTPSALVAETAASAARSRCPRWLQYLRHGHPPLCRSQMFDDLPYDFYAALPPWYRPALTAVEVADYFLCTADSLKRPLVI